MHDEREASGASDRRLFRLRRRWWGSCPCRRRSGNSARDVQVVTLDLDQKAASFQIRNSDVPANFRKFLDGCHRGGVKERRQHVDECRLGNANGGRAKNLSGDAAKLRRPARNRQIEQRHPRRLRDSGRDRRSRRRRHDDRGARKTKM